MFQCPDKTVNNWCNWSDEGKQLIAFERLPNSHMWVVSKELKYEYFKCHFEIHFIFEEGYEMAANI